MSSALPINVIKTSQPEVQVQTAPDVNFAYLDERTKRMIRRAILKAVAIPGYQVPFGSREMPLPYGWGTGGIQVTASVIGPEDKLKVIDQGSDDTVNVARRLCLSCSFDRRSCRAGVPAEQAFLLTHKNTHIQKH
jgi:alpha-D-ribose 1-methylphosphonate 5-phosphate C-P lyase